MQAKTSLHTIFGSATDTWGMILGRSLYLSAPYLCQHETDTYSALEKTVKRL